MTANDEVFLNAASGISIEEQKEILSAINGIAEKNRRRLSSGAFKEAERQNGKRARIDAKKSGAVFPLAVNVSAAAALCAGALLLISFNGKTDLQLRSGNAVYNLTERALIEDIRKDTAEKLAAKETEILFISSRLEEVDAQLLLLTYYYVNNPSAQTDERERLLNLQFLYREELAVLQDERSQILEASRLREAPLRAVLEEREREFLSRQQNISEELDSAMKELERLSGEQEKIAAIDAQVAGALSSVNALVRNGQYAQALSAVGQIRLFLGAGFHVSSRSFQARRDFYYQAIDFAQEMIVLNSNAGGTLVISEVGGQTELELELEKANAQLEQKAADLQKTIDTLSSGSSGQAARLTELESAVTTLRSSVSSLENASAEKDRTISALQTERNNLARDNQLQEQEITSLRNQISIIRDLLQD
jgi:hypothetical protein